jgi:hypothetical protein
VEFELLILNVYQPEELICEILVYFDLKKEGFDGHVDYELKFFFLFTTLFQFFVFNPLVPTERGS